MSKYKVNLINRTNHTIVIKDGLNGDWEVGLSISGEIRNEINDNNTIVLQPGENKTTTFSFEKFYDTGNEPEGIFLNAVRVMDNYTGNPDTAQAE